jgi:cytochrome c551/c552
MARTPRRKSPVSVGEVLLWVLFFLLLVPAGAVGWAIGNSGSGTKTVTVTVGAASTTTAASTTSGAATATAAPATTATATSRPAATTTATVAAGGNAAQGKALFSSLGCGACHTFAPAGASAKIGPDLDTRPALDAKTAKMPLAAFVRESIVKPNAFVAPGYAKGIMPTTFASLPKTKLDTLVAFIVAGKK